MQPPVESETYYRGRPAIAKRMGTSLSDLTRRMKRQEPLPIYMDARWNFRQHRYILAWTMTETSYRDWLAAKVRASHGLKGDGGTRGGVAASIEDRAGGQGAAQTPAPPESRRADRASCQSANPVERLRKLIEKGSK